MERKAGAGRKLELNRETLGQLELQAAQTAGGSIVGTALTCAVSCGGSCAYTCPGISC